MPHASAACLRRRHQQYRESKISTPCNSSQDKPSCELIDQGGQPYCGVLGSSSSISEIDETGHVASRIPVPSLKQGESEHK